MMCRRVARAIAFDYGNARRTSRHRAGTDSAAVYIVALKTAVYELCTLTGIRTMCTLLLAVSRCGLAVRRLAGKQKDLGSIRFGSLFSSLQKLWLWTLSCDFTHTINETLKWRTQLPTLMQSHSGGDSVMSRY